jgi:hypothetical protein
MTLPFMLIAVKFTSLLKIKTRCNYGILPDTIFKIIDSTYVKVENDTTKESLGCDDCVEVALKIIAKGDTTLKYKVLIHDTVFQPVIKTLQTFVDSGKHNTIKSVTAFETQNLNFREKSGM